MDTTLAFPLPTLSHLGVDASSIPPDLSVHQVVAEWFSAFTHSVKSSDVQGVTRLLVPNQQAYWRDILALTWDFRTFAGIPKIEQFLADRLALSQLSQFKLQHEEYTALIKPYPDVVWIQFLFSFEVGDVGLASGVVRLVPVPTEDAPDTTPGIEWKAYAVLTRLDDLKHHPEKIGALRNKEPYHGKWAEERQRAAAFEEEDPVVLIIGAGQSGLEVAARLKCLDVSCLVVEKEERVGGNWRSRYEALCLHDPVWYDHMPYLPFPPNWPVFSPAIKLANWLESYVEAMELNVWKSSAVTHASHDATTGLWTVTVKRSDVSSQSEVITERVLKVKHVVFASGFHGGDARMPQYAGMDEFKGEILHSLQHKKAADHAGKKVVVVGSCTSAHDIAADYYEHGVDVTMFQRSSTYIMSTEKGLPVLLRGLYEEGGLPTHIADLISASFPNLMMVGVGRRQVQEIAALDKNILDGLHERGFRTNLGLHDAGFLLLAWEKAGGYYLDVGASQLIIDGKIKLKSDSQIERFTKNGIKFENGSELEADVVVFSTGLGDSRSSIRRICGEEIMSQIQPVWGMNAEGELNGVWRDMGVPGLWCMMGNLALCRFHSKHVALQIKAMETQGFGTRYSKA